MRLRIASCGLVVLGAVLLATASTAQVASDRAAAILVFPKVVVDTSNVAGRGRMDTLIRISNTSNTPVRLQCFWINANGHCFNAPNTICDYNATNSVATWDQTPLRDPRCGTNSYCVPGWQEADFIVNITARQPVAWLASQGAFPCDSESNGPAPCFAIPGSGVPGPNNNAESRVPGVAEDPFIGELKCIAVDRTDVPIDRNVLKGEAEIVRSEPGVIDTWAYNALGFPAIPNANNGDNVLVLGGDAAEYAGCPNVLILDHYFDGVTDPVTDATVITHVTLVPCTEDLLTQQPIASTAQFLVFNEFEQRFSTSTKVSCFGEFQLSRIDTRSPRFSIFSAGVSGTMTGQTRIRGVADADRTHGHALLGVAEEFRNGQGTAAFNLHFQGSRPQSDFIYLPFQ
jgi:hypothetical protein